MLAALGGLAALVMANWEPARRLGELTAPRYDPALAGGGLSSRDLGVDVLAGSLAEVDPIGFEILIDAEEEGVIDNFAQIESKPGFVDEYVLDGRRFKLRFRNSDSFVLIYPPDRTEVKSELDAIARRYGFFANEVSDQLDALKARSEDLDNAFYDRPLTFGIPESDLAAEAAALIDDWERWVRAYGEHPETAQLAEAWIRVLSTIEAVSSRPTNAGLRSYDAAVNDLNRAIDAYNETL